MRPRALVAAALIGAAAVPALAQDGPPPPPVPPAPPPAAPAAPAPAPAAPAKHENKISDAAKAAWEAMEKAAYNPVNAGLKELQGKMHLKVEAPGMEDSGMPPMTADFTVSVKAPTEITVDGSTESPMLQMQFEQMKAQVKQLLTMSLGHVRSTEGEFDADVEEKDGKKTLVVKIFEQNEPRGEMRMEIDSRGLPAKGVMKAVDPMTGMEGSMESNHIYVAEGDRFRMEKLLVTNQMGNTEMAFSYLDAGGIKLMSEIRGKIEAIGVSLHFKYTELTVNGKKVEIPAEKAPEKPAEQPATPTGPAVPPGPMPPAPPPEGPK